MAINTTDLTTQLTTGDGVFDVLMGGVRSQLQEEFDQNRIRGNDYATVFTALVSAAMQSAVQYTLQKPLVDQQVINTAAELDAINLKDDMIQQEIRNLQATEAKVKAEALNVPKQGNVIDAQHANLISENKVIELQDDLITQQIANEVSTKANIEANTANTVAELPNHHLMDDKTQAEIDYLASQKDVADGNALKAAAENALLAQKKITEEAQTQPIADPNSVIGRQLVLYTNQANGYIRDQEVKAARLFTDVANVQLNINENYDTATNGLDDANIKKTLDKVRIGVGAV